MIVRHRLLTELVKLWRDNELYGYGTSTINTILLAIGTTAISTVITLFIGLDKSEKKFVKSIFNKMLKKIS